MTTKVNFKSPLSAFLIMILLAGACKKDTLHWQKVQKLNSNTSCRLNHIKFINNNICIIAGGEIFSQAEVLRSVDGGYTWAANSYPNAGKSMFGLGVSAQGKIYLCGVDGTILHSSDTGNTWQVGRILDWLHYVGASFPTPDTGVFVSTVLERQSTITQVDTNFAIIDQVTYQFGLNDIYMVSPSTGYVAGYGAVMKTTDYRRTWNFQDVAGDNFTAMDIHGSEIWMCGSNGGIYHTTNGGAEWKRLRNGNNIALPRYYLRCILFKDMLIGWAAGDDGLVIYTNDGGNHWMEYDKFTSSTLRSMALCPNGDLLMTGDNGALFRIMP